MPPPTDASPLALAYAIAPKHVRDFIDSDQYDVFMRGLSNRFNLRIDTLNGVGLEVLMTILGIAQPKDLATRLTTHAKVPQESLDPIMEEINTRIFIPLRDAARTPAPVEQEDPSLEEDLKVLEWVDVTAPSELPKAPTPPVPAYAVTPTPPIVPSVDALQKPPIRVPAPTPPISVSPPPVPAPVPVSPAPQSVTPPPVPAPVPSPQPPTPAPIALNADGGAPPKQTPVEPSASEFRTMEHDMEAVQRGEMRAPQAPKQVSAPPPIPSARISTPIPTPTPSAPLATGSDPYREPIE